MVCKPKQWPLLIYLPEYSTKPSSALTPRVLRYLWGEPRSWSPSSLSCSLHSLQRARSRVQTQQFKTCYWLRSGVSPNTILDLKVGFPKIVSCQGERLNCRRWSIPGVGSSTVVVKPKRKRFPLEKQDSFVNAFPPLGLFSLSLWDRSQCPWDLGSSSPGNPQGLWLSGGGNLREALCKPLLSWSSLLG